MAYSVSIVCRGHAFSRRENFKQKTAERIRYHRIRSAGFIRFIKPLSLSGNTAVFAGLGNTVDGIGLAYTAVFLSDLAILTVFSLQSQVAVVVGAGGAALEQERRGSRERHEKQQ